MEPLDDTNWPTWRLYMQAHLMEKECWAAVIRQEALLTPTQIAELPEKERIAESAALSLDTKAKGMIMKRVSLKALHLINPSQNAREIWQGLQQSFELQTVSRVVHLLRELQTLKMLHKESVAEYFARAEKLHMTLRAAGEAVEDAALIRILLAGLPSSYDSVIDTLDGQNLVLRDIQSRLQLKEGRLKLAKTDSVYAHKGIAYAAHGSRRQQNGRRTGGNNCRNTCHGCGSTEHWVKDCPHNSMRSTHSGAATQSRKPEMVCTNCGLYGHLAENCQRPGKSAHGKMQTGKQRAGQSKVTWAFTASSVYEPVPTDNPEECTIEEMSSVALSASGGGAEMEEILEEVPADKPEGLAHAVTEFNKHVVYDPSDWQLHPHLFDELQDELGVVFTLDGASDPAGTNAQVSNFCSREKDFLKEDLRGQTIWLNPPYRSIARFVDHYSRQKALSPANTSCCLIVPHNEKASWWEKVKNWKVVKMWEPNSDLFTKPDGNGGRKKLRTCHFPVVALWDEPAEKGRTLIAAPASKGHNLILDSGSDNHVTGSKELLTNYSTELESLPQYIAPAGGDLLKVEGTGDLRVQSKVSDGSFVDVVFKRVLYVPGVTHTLISLGKITEGGTTAKFSGNDCFVFAGAKELLHAQKGTSRPGLANLYTVNCLPKNASQVCAATSTAAAAVKLPVELWHRRLAHIAPANLKKTVTMVDGMKLDDKTSLEGVCEPCIAGRMTREPRKTVQDKSSLKPLDRAYADLIGPMETQSLNGNSYLLVLIDEASKFSLVKPLKKKSEVKLELPILITELERLGNGKLARLRTDCGGEFTS